MRTKRLLALILAVFLIIITSACSKKDFATVTLDPCVLEFGEIRELTPVLAAEEGDVVVTTTMAENTVVGLSAVYTDGKLSLVGETPGNYSLTFTQSAKGYNDGTLTMSVTVKEPPPPPLEVAIFSEILGINNSLPPKSDIAVNMEQGLLSTMSVMSKTEGFTITAESSDPCLVVAVNGSEVTLDPVAAGTATLTITASHPDYSDAVGSCSIEVRPPHVSLAFSGDVKTPIKVNVGQSTAIPVEYDGTLSLSVSSDIATAEVSPADGKVTVKGVKEGSCTVNLTATKEGFQDTELAVELTVAAAPQPPVANTPKVAASKYSELEAEILKYINIERAAVESAPLKINATMSKAALLRAQETAENQSHTRPDGSRGLTVFDDFKLSKFNLLGENLAGGDSSESGDEIVARWMASPSHRAALLDPRFSETGIGAYYDGEMYRYCQLFGGVVTA